MLMLNRSKINILFLHYILYILIFQSLIEILPADFSFLPILFNAWYYRLFTFSAGKTHLLLFLPSKATSSFWWIIPIIIITTKCSTAWVSIIFFPIPTTWTISTESSFWNTNFSFNFIYFVFHNTSSNLNHKILVYL